MGDVHLECAEKAHGVDIEGDDCQDRPAHAVALSGLIARRSDLLCTIQEFGQQADEGDELQRPLGVVLDQLVRSRGCEAPRRHRRTASCSRVAHPGRCRRLGR